MSVDPTKVLNGIAADDRITAGMYFRLTFGQYGIFKITELTSAFQRDIQHVYDALDAADGWAQPSSDLAVPPGEVTAVFDVLVRPVAVGITAADLANYFNGLNLAVDLTSMTPVPVASVIGGADERSTLQSELSAAATASNPLAVFGSYAKYLSWILILLIIVALLYYGEKAFKVAKAVV